MHTKILALAIATSLSPLMASASDGTVSFGGELITDTCTITGPANFTVTLPTVPVASLANLYNKAGETQFSIFVTGCSAGVSGANVYFEDGPNVLSADDTLKNNASVGAATNVELILRTTDGEVLDLVSNGGVQYTQFVNNVSSNTGRLDFRVAYMATGVVTPGVVQSSITYSMVYN